MSNVVKTIGRFEALIEAAHRDFLLYRSAGMREEEAYKLAARHLAKDLLEQFPQGTAHEPL